MLKKNTLAIDMWKIRENPIELGYGQTHMMIVATTLSFAIKPPCMPLSGKRDIEPSYTLTSIMSHQKL